MKIRDDSHSIEAMEQVIFRALDQFLMENNSLTPTSFVIFRRLSRAN